MKDYRNSNIPLAKRLRKEMTPWERKLWYLYLKDYPVRFQRQKAIGDYIADFYCAKAQLVIELDGGGHYEPEQQAKDLRRTQILNAMGITVVRICNTDIDKNFRGVCSSIDSTVSEEMKKPKEHFDWKHSGESSLPQSASLTAPSSEGAKRLRKP